MLIPEKTLDQKKTQRRLALGFSSILTVCVIIFLIVGGFLNDESRWGFSLAKCGLPK
jgi:hypothetical protein